MLSPISKYLNDNPYPCWIEVWDSDIGSIDNETEKLDFPNDEFQNLLNDFIGGSR